jgi:DNA-binding CsgD family transcriptional regulator
MGIVAQKALKEREKELDSLYALAELCARPGLRREELLHEASAVLREAFQKPEGIRIGITYRNIRIPGGGVEEGSRPCLRAPIPGGPDGTAAGEIIALYENPPTGEPFFLEREKLLLESTGKLLGVALRRLAAESRGRRQNAALREVLVQIEGERRRFARKIRGCLQREVLPLVRRMKDEAGESGKTAAALLLGVLENLPGTDLNGGFEDYNLSPRETEICGLVRGGMPSKEIAVFLGLSEPTVERHRHNIRKKIGIDKDVSLASYLNRRGP